MFLRSLRSKVIVLVALAAAPPLAFFGHVMMRDRRVVVAQSKEELTLLAGLLAEHYEGRIAGAEDLLAAFASDPYVASMEADGCSRSAKRFVASERDLVNVGLIDLQGRVLCSALPLKDPVDLADRAYFRDALERRRFAVGEFQIGRITGAPSLNVGYPILRAGRPVGVAFAALAAKGLARPPAGLALDADSVILLVDRNGTVVARHPPAEGWEGRRLAGTAIGAAVVGGASGFLEGDELDGHSRMYAFGHLLDLSPEIKVVLGISHDRHRRALEEVQIRMLLGVLAAMLAVLALTWWYGERFILRGVDALAGAVRSFGAGDLTARVPPNGDDELGRLGSAFNEMAERLEEAVARQRLILDSAAEGIIGFDGTERVSFVNAAATKLLGWEQAELLGVYAGRACHGPEADTAEHRATCPLRRALDRHEPFRASEESFVRKDGGRFAVECSLAPMLKEGAYHGAVIVFRDVSAERALRSQFLQAQKMESVGRLAGGVAHDFNNILTVIGGFAHFLTAGLAKDDPKLSDIEEIRRAAERGSALTRQLLTFSRQQVIELRVLDPNAVLGGCLKMLRRLVGEEIELKMELAPGLGSIRADPGQLEQVVMNLAVNAKDAMPGGGKLLVRTAAVTLDDAFVRGQPDLSPGPYVVLEVADDGTGIAPDVLPKIFEPFFTTKEKGKGTGLGLATVHGIARQHHGAVLVDTEPGKGTTFRVYFPRLAEADAGPAESPDAAAPGGSERLLLVEDDEPVRRLAQRMLSGEGYDVLEFSDPLEALRRAGPVASRFKLLVTDVVMPGMRGPELARELRERHPGLKVLFVSGYADGAASAKDLLEGSHLLMKPLTPGVLARKVREILDA